MKILFMADVPPDPNSGAAGTELRTIAALRELGHDVDEVWAGDLGRRIQHGNLHYLLELPGNYRRALEQRVARADYDVIHVNQPHGFAAARWLRRRGAGAVFIHRSHGFEPLVDQVVLGWRRRLGAPEGTVLRRAASGAVRVALERNYRGIARWADGHIVSATRCADALREMYGVETRRIAVIPQAPAAEYVDAPPPPVAPRLHRILHVGQFVFAKAPMIVARTFNELAGRDPRLEFTWLCARRHHELVRSMLSPEARVRVELLDWMPSAELPGVFDRHGVFVFPSFFEGFGKVFIEAMARGLVVVASDMGGPHDVIRSGRDGVLVPAGDADAVAAAVQRLVTAPAAAAEMSEHAAARAREFTWRRVAEESLSFYERVRSMR